MLFTTTPTVEGYPIKQYMGVVTGESVIRNFSYGTYEQLLENARNESMNKMAHHAAQAGAKAVVGIDIDYGCIGLGGSASVVACSGTAVII